MEATTQVKLESLAPYLHLFPKPLGIDKTVKMGATVSDTVNLIPQIIRKTAWQVEKYVDQELKGLPAYAACEKLWYFVKYHIKYEPDARGIEMVRSPRRFIWDKKGDCDCGTTYIGACIFSLAMKGIKGVRSLILRITKYKRDYFQHIYPVVKLNDGTEIILDFVVHQFNYEEPYTEKKDYTMELQFLDGIDDKNLSLMGKDVEQILGTDSDLGKILKRAAKNSGGGGGGKKPGLFKKKTPEQKQVKKEKRKETIKKVGKGVKKGLNVVNKVNPATALLRAGILASMKLNVMKVAEHLRWAYAPRELAQSKGMDMSKYDKLKNVLKKTEDIFYTAGGKPENLRKAILTGRGNRSKEVAGLEGINETSTLPQILGAIYHDEFVNGMEGFEGIKGTDGLGSATAAGASMAAAASTMGALAVLIKAIGSLFPNKGKEKKGKKSANKNNGGEAAEYTEPGGEEASAEESPAEPEAESTEAQEESSDNLPAPAEETEVTASEDESEPPAETSETPAEETTEGLGGLASIKDFFDKNGKALLISAGVAAIAVTAVALISRHIHKKKEEQKLLPQPKQVPTINGVPKQRKKKKKGGNRYDLDGTETVVALM